MTREQVNKRSLFSDARAILEKVGRGKTILKVKKKKIIFSQGDASDAVYYILKGQVNLTVVSPKGKEAVVATLERENFFGEGCLAGRLNRIATARSITESSIVRIEKATMIWMLQDEPIFSEFFMTYMLRRNSRIEEDMVDQIFNSSEKRLARILLLLAHIEKNGKAETIIPHVTHETLADMVGVTRSKISFLMNKFKKLDMIDNKNGLRIHNSLLNILLHD